MNLPEKIGVWGEHGETFSMIYRGNSEVDRHYTKPMLPWIISEVKNRQKSDEVTVEVKHGVVVVRDVSSGVVYLTHTVKQIHKCVMEQADHTCFLYTLKPAGQETASCSFEPGYIAASDPDVLVPDNMIPANQNYLCYLFQAPTEQEVLKFFACLRQQPRDATLVTGDSSNTLSAMNSLPDLSVHNDSQFFEVMFVGRVKVSHSKVPATFIDEALGAFKHREKARERNPSGNDSSGSSGDLQNCGSGPSLPNIKIGAAASVSLDLRSRSTSRERGVMVTPSEITSEQKSQQAKVRFTLWACDPDQPDLLHCSQACSLTPVPDSPFPSSSPQKSSLTPVLDAAAAEELPSPGFNDSVFDLETRTNDTKMRHPLSENGTVEDQAANISDIEPFRQRLKTISGPTRPNFNKPESGMRARAGSIGSASTRYRTSDLKVLGGHDFNRTMLFHIGHSEIQLINPEMKSVQLNKPFKDIAHCCQECWEVSIESSVYLGYVFKCQINSVTDEIMQALSKAFAAQHSAQLRERQENLMCDQCPMKWYSDLCAEVEGLPAAKGHIQILKKIHSLPEDVHTILIAKYEGTETSDTQLQNNILMMLLRAHFECQQTSHSHTALPGGGVKPEYPTGSNLSESLNRAKKSLAVSFNRVLKREGRDSESCERETRPEDTPAIVRRASISGDGMMKQESTNSSWILEANPEPYQPVWLSSHQEKTSLQEEAALNNTLNSPVKTGPSDTPPPKNVRMESISDSPLGEPRPRARPGELKSTSRSIVCRSSTVSGAGGDSMRREFLAKRNRQKATIEDKTDKKPPHIITSSKMNMFLKFGSPAKAYEEEQSSNIKNKSKHPSFRHEILQRVISPSSKHSESINTMHQLRTSTPEKPVETKKRSLQQLMLVWRKATFHQILLNRMEREACRMRAEQQEVELQRVRLDYDEEPPASEAMQAWNLMLSKPQARIDSNILYSGLKQGVPKCVRGEVWKLLVYQYNHRQTRPPVLPSSFNTPYEDMLRELTSMHHAILIDLGRTFPTHPYFLRTLGPGQLSLFNILKAYSLLDKEVGYCQGLSFVGGILLLHVEEEDAYGLLRHIMYLIGCRKQYRPDLVGLQVEMYQLSRLLHDKLRELYDHLEQHEIIPQLYAAPWFLTLFGSQFPISFVARVFDLLFLEGLEAIFKVALVLLQTHQETLLACDTFEQIMDYMKNILPRIPLSQQGKIIAKAMDCNISSELSTYEVEYHVLQEEAQLSPAHDTDIRKMREANKNLKQQNLDLLEQLHNTTQHQIALETSNHTLQQSQHHLEVRVRWLELERNNLKQLITILTEAAPSEAVAKIPANLKRYIPTQNLKEQPEKSAETQEKDNEKQSNDEEVKENYDKLESSLTFQPLVHTPHTLSSLTPATLHSSPFSSHGSPSPTRTTSLDSGGIQKFMKRLVSHEN